MESWPTIAVNGKTCRSSTTLTLSRIGWVQRGKTGHYKDMEILLFLVALILFDIAAWFWGADSRVVMDDGRSVDPPSRRWI